MKNKLHGYIFTLAAVSIFAAQDGLSKYLGTHYPPVLVAMIRYWAFAAFVLFLAARAGGIRRAATTARPFLQIFRGVILAAQIVVMIYAFAEAGMAMSQAILQGTPLLITLLSAPLLGEKVGWRRITAITIGLFGVLLIINPIGADFGPLLLVPVLGAFMFALYGIATRAVGRVDRSMTSFFYTGVAGAVAISLVGPFYLTPLAPQDWFWMGVLCMSGMLSHYLLIRAYDILEASEVQPLTYFQLVIGSFIAVMVFGERLSWNMVAGAIIVVGAGLFTVWREHHLAVKKAKGELTAR
ncbi:DMT family transporter [Rhizobiaceae bacterium BDR2-2]|uniref:DMT family transporter n=1 Tax=Ectorhizobium quercum TaxID=2965071 RepID=A0AAE3SVS9_9HYPH|nr:DMT family transporter [Ectorhizobium quercum]MCX8997988.1 DMT family transporter [Ectorhizobium quercum]